MTLPIIIIAWLVLGYIGARLYMWLGRTLSERVYREFALFVWVAGPVGLAAVVMATAIMVCIGAGITLSRVPAPAFLSALLKKVLP